MNKVKNTLVILLVLLIGYSIGATQQQPKANAMTINEAIDQNYKPRGTNFHIINTYTKGNKTINEYNNSSWSLYDDKDNLYIFCPMELGDYEINCKNKEELDNLISTYKSMYENGYF